MEAQLKTFTRHITPAELIAACEREEFPCNAQKYLEEGDDHIHFGFQHGRIYVSALYNAVSGCAFGEYATSTGSGALKKGIEFSTDDRLDGAPWFDALLSFLYVA